ncbi:MAG: S8/S53 family peptidase [bacterium]|nr:S8/S53 family peptidase [bacterium]
MARLSMFVLVVAMSLVGTPGALMAGDQGGGGEGPPPIEVEGPFDPQAGLTPWAWVGIKSPDEPRCPDPGPSWNIEQSFVPIPGEGGPSVPTELDRYCTYEWRGEGFVTEEATQALQKLELRGLLDELEEDRAIVSGASSQTDQEPTLEPLVWRALADHFAAQAGALPQIASPTGVPARLSIVDSTPTQKIKPWARESRSGHGHALLNMARTLLCNSNDCLAEVTSRLALRRYRDPDDPDKVYVDDFKGGDFGTLMDLARAIQAEVADWENDAVPGQRLVLNLSVGWDARHTLGSSMPLAARAVRHAIEDARCRNVLVIVAVGNMIGGPPGPHSEVAWRPGGWEALSTLTVDQCKRALGRPLDADELPPPATTYNPLVHTVGGIRSSGYPVANQIPKMRPRLAAHSEAAVVEGHEPGEPTVIATGSSIGAAITSIAAAAAWQLLPQWHGAEIIDLIHDSGDLINGVADLCLPGPGGTGCAPSGGNQWVRRVSLCRAVGAACVNVPGGCPQQPTACPPWKDLHAQLPINLLAEFQQATPLEVDLDTLDQDYGFLPECRVLSARYDEQYPPANLCPHRQFRGGAAYPWVRRAPESIPCPPCMLHRGPGTAMIEIDLFFRTPLSDPTLEACGVSYSLPFVPAPGQQVLLTGVNIGACSSAVLTFKTASGDSIINPVLIVP